MSTVTPVQPSRRQWIEARADAKRSAKVTRHGTTQNVPVVGSFQSSPSTGTPFKIRAVGHSDSGMTRYDVVVELTRDEALKLCEDFIAFGVAGRHGRIETKAAQ